MKLHYSLTEDGETLVILIQTDNGQILNTLLWDLPLW